MDYSNAIKKYKTLDDGTSEYRIYAVYPFQNKFVFECSSWTPKADNTALGSLKVHEEYSNPSDAIDRYNQYLNAWEPETRRV